MIEKAILTPIRVAVENESAITISCCIVGFSAPIFPIAMTKSIDREENVLDAIIDT